MYFVSASEMIAKYDDDNGNDNDDERKKSGQTQNRWSENSEGFFSSLFDEAIQENIEAWNYSFKNKTELSSKMQFVDVSHFRGNCEEHC